MWILSSFKERKFKDAEFDTSIANLFFMFFFFFLKLRFNPQLPHSQCLWSGKNIEILTLTQTQKDSQIFLLPWLVPACSKFSQIRGSLKVIPSWKNIIFEHEVPTRSADGHYIIKDTHIAFSLTLHFSLRGNFFFLSSTDPGETALVALPVKAASVLTEENLRVISCLCLWMSRCSSDWKRWANKKGSHQNRNCQIFSLIV